MDHSEHESWLSHDTSQEKKNLSFQSLGDKLPVPVELSALCEAMEEAEDDCYRIGDFHFRTIQTVGIIADKTVDDSKITYILHDPNNCEKTFQVVQFGTTDDGGSRFVDPSLEEDMRVKVIGKLKNVAGYKTILCFFMQSLPDEKDYEIFKLESEVSRLFFQKNLIEKMRRNQTSEWSGMLAPPSHRQIPIDIDKLNKYIEDAKPHVPAPKKEAPPVKISPPKRKEVAVPTSPAVSIEKEEIKVPQTPEGLKNKILAIIRSESRQMQCGDSNGVPFATILRRAGNIPEPRLRQYMKDLEDRSIVYIVLEDDYMLLST